MRYILTIIFACIVIAPPAFAMPAASSNHISKNNTTMAAAKHSHPRSSNHGRSSSLGGIHPLVGSGNY